MKKKIDSYEFLLNKFEENLEKFPNFKIYGRISSVNNFMLEATGLYFPVGTLCEVECFDSGLLKTIRCQIVGFKRKYSFLLPQENTFGVFPGAKVFLKDSFFKIYNFFPTFPFGKSLLGRVLDSQGNPLDTLGKLKNVSYLNIFNTSSINPLIRAPIKEIFDTGIRSINSLLTIGVGQRVGIYSRPGLGKSTLLGMISRHAIFDVLIIGLIGERGREVQEFIEIILGKNVIKKSIVIVAPADSSSFFRMQAVCYTTAIAEYFKDLGQNVLLIIDSLTRYAMAYRELALSTGEAPISKGYPASIFSNIPMLIERTGNFLGKLGSITAFYTILTEGDEYNDPILDISKAILDGHIILSSFLSNSGHYPAINIELSLSRVMSSIISENHYKNSIFLRKLISCYYSNRDLINVGAYCVGNNILLDQSMKIWSNIENFLQQKFLQNFSYQESIKELDLLLTDLK